MNDEGISSLAVVDNNTNVIGNISTVDVKVCRISYDSAVIKLTVCSC
jgi:hypothetical protein